MSSKKVIEKYQMSTENKRNIYSPYGFNCFRNQKLKESNCKCEWISKKRKKLSLMEMGTKQENSKYRNTVKYEAVL